MRRTKIIASLGPATDPPDVLAGAIEAGLDVARLNASHAEVDALGERLGALRAAAERAGRVVAAMLDLPGPKLRVGEIVPGTMLEQGHEFRIVAGECIGDADHACISYSGIVRDLHAGDRVLVDDGRIELLVEDVSSQDVCTSVVVGGELSSHKGVNVPGVTLGVESVTVRDTELVRWALESGIDIIAQSFVRGPEDIHRVRELMGDRRVPIVAKIEKHEAVARLGEIIDAADAIMVARGDLGVELAPERVPVIQRSVVKAARRRGRPVIIATQMLESMTMSPRPTRAEASDVANAIFEKVDAVMLSGESAVGYYPVQSVETMARIATTAEEMPPSLAERGRHHANHTPTDIQQAVSDAVVDLAQDLTLAAIVTPTQSGATALAVARHRPLVPIIAPTPSAEVARRLCIVWGVTPLVVELPEDTDVMLEAVCRAGIEAGLIERGSLIAITAGRATRIAGGTDFVHVREV
ncbi:MAG: pyruvate kinase [Coriobacteriales bacterium]|nr:pyruvate kinase [Coriobacteriales bacterium]